MRIVPVSVSILPFPMGSSFAFEIELLALLLPLVDRGERLVEVEVVLEVTSPPPIVRPRMAVEESCCDELFRPLVVLDPPL